MPPSRGNYCNRNHRQGDGNDDAEMVAGLVIHSKELAENKTKTTPQMARGLGLTIKTIV